MSNLFHLLTRGNNSSGYIEPGIIAGRLGDNVYQVRIGSRVLPVKAAISDPLHKGARVIINRTDVGRYIIGVTNQLKTQETEEVIVDG